NFIERRHFVVDRRHVGKETHCLFYRRIQDISNILAFIVYLQRLAVVAFALTDFTWNIHIRKEIHLNLDDSLALASFTPATFDIEREAACLVATYSGFGHLGE